VLTSDLLVTRTSGGKIRPVYAAFNPENLELAELLIETFKQNVGKTYGDLLAELEGYEEMNYRFIRGLSQLLGRRAVVETSSAVDPSRAREAVFEACEGMALFPAERKEALQKASKNLSISVSDLEKSLWADLEENQILKEFNPPVPAELLRQYNISLTQTLLFRAVDLDIWITGGYQRVLWKILRSGLMYTLEDMQETENGTKESRIKENKRIDETEETDKLKSVHLHLDGPASLFRMSERYGNSFAKLFPVLLKSKGWKLKAGILHKGYQGKRVLDFALDSSEEAFRFIPKEAGYPEGITPDFQLAEGQEGYGTEIRTNTGKKAGFAEKKAETQQTETQEAETDTELEAYDSTYEQQFANLSFGGWEVKREPAILKAGRFAFVPDFSLQKNGIKVYAEIVGFWTPEYLKKKVEKLKEVREPVFLLINRKLRCSEKDFPAQDVIFFDRKIPANEVTQVLRKYEEKRLAEDRSRLHEIDIPLSGEMINLEEIAAEKGVMAGALKKVLADRLVGAREPERSGVEKDFEGHKDSEKKHEDSEKKHEDSGKYREYVLLENYVIHRQLLDRIKRGLEKPGTAETYADAVKIFGDLGLDSSLYYPVLEYLGYKVIWTGLSEENAKIKKNRGD
jgi:predicted nuclease of restriction endonuclease-like RecB superfamily